MIILATISNSLIRHILREMDACRIPLGVILAVSLFIYLVIKRNYETNVLLVRMLPMLETRTHTHARA